MHVPSHKIQNVCSKISNSCCGLPLVTFNPYEPGSKLLVLVMVIQPLMTGILIMGPYKPLRNWVDEFIPYYMEMSWEWIDPMAHMKHTCTSWTGSYHHVEPPNYQRIIRHTHWSSRSTTQCWLPPIRTARGAWGQHQPTFLELPWGGGVCSIDFQDSMN